MALTENQVKKISLAYQANEGNAEGIAYWVNSGVNDATAASIFYAANTSLQSLSGLALATKIFENLGLNAETHPGFNQEGLAYWGNLIDSGAVAKDQSGLVIANAVRDDLGLTDDTFTQHIEKIKNITPSGETFMLTPMTDVASTSISYHGNMESGTDTFKFTNQADNISADSLTFGSGDKLIDDTVGDGDIFTLTLKNYDTNKSIGTSVAGDVGSGATLTGIETFAIVSNGAGKVKFTENTSHAVDTLKVSGTFTDTSVADGTSGSGAFEFVGLAANKITTVDASGVGVGSILLNASLGTGAAVTLIAGSDSDYLKVGTKGGTLTGNGGVDTFNVSVAKTADNTKLANLTVTTITDVVKGEKIVFSGATAVGTKVDLTGVTDETAVWAKMIAEGSGADSNNNLLFGTWNGNTYVIDYGSSDTTTDDILVKLVGEVDLTDSTFAAATKTLTV